MLTATILNTKISEIENKIPDHAKCITTQEFNTLTIENFAARLKQANLVSKTDFDIKLITFNSISFNYRNKRKYLLVQRKLSRLIIKDYDFFLGRIHFTTNDGSQNTFVYQPTFDTSEIKKKQRH